MKLTEEEINALKALKNNTEKITKEFGLIKLAQLNINSREKQALELLETVKKQEKDIANLLEEKYGRGSIDIDKGTFTPA